MRQAVNSASNLTVFGSFGFGNLGDELVPTCFRHMAAAAGRDCKVQALSRFGKIPAGEFTPYPDQHDPVDGPLILSGGGIIEARPMSCMNRAFALQTNRPELKIATHAVSVEPGKTFTRRQRRALARQMHEIGPSTVRDVLSAETLMQLAPGHTTRVIGDIALWMEPAGIPADLATLIPDQAIPVILGDFWDTPDFFDWITRDLTDLARNMGQGLVLLPFSGQFGKDIPLHAKLRDLLAINAPDIEVAYPAETLPFERFSPGIVAAILKAAPLAVSMRLHGCVVSYAMQTPFLGIAYHPKLRGFAETIGWPEALVPGKLPLRQSPDTYGFAFADLDLKPGALSRAADRILVHTDFSAISYFRRLQVVAFRDALDRLGV